MFRIGVIGGGVHSRVNHLPALGRYVEQHPGDIQLAAFCDLNPSVVEQSTEKYRFSQGYTDLNEMLSRENLDGCIAVTPVEITASVAQNILAAGIPLLMEKPPGASLEEAREICGLVERLNSRVMVSVNRRFDPAISAARAWWDNRPLETLRVTMLRARRTELGFFSETGIHAVDTMRSIAGDILGTSAKGFEVNGVWRYQVQFEFESGARGQLEVLPNCGVRQERYELFGENCYAIAATGEADSGTFTAWQNEEVVQQYIPAQDIPFFVKNGTYAETCEFISALKEGQAPRPSPKEVLQSVELCSRIQKEVQSGAGF